ncbi:hypothetical protein SAMN05421541_106210 [Actinoplanes philippinensis]|uniref:Uncharacterized protein n=1 Tax=Actinoplanes philippinensis TaxID=35752 RepID=A0A1I2G443_9ACTN|nr:hypothetical protein SAMN05421541_106210 [Actinoplanes philippinensis]
MSVVAGAVLGLLAFSVDAVDGTARQVMIALVSAAASPGAQRHWWREARPRIAAVR